jgi:hypothetical protein
MLKFAIRASTLAVFSEVSMLPETVSPEDTTVLSICKATICGGSFGPGVAAATAGAAVAELTGAATSEDVRSEAGVGLAADGTAVGTGVTLALAVGVGWNTGVLVSGVGEAVAAVAWATVVVVVSDVWLVCAC